MESKKTSKKSNKAAEIAVSPLTVTETPLPDSKPVKHTSAAKSNRTPTSVAKAATTPSPEAKKTIHRHSKLATPPTPAAISLAPATATKAPLMPPAAEKVEPPVTVAAAPAPEAKLSYDEVAKLAYRYWEERNDSHGSPEEDWQRAEKALSAKA